MAEATFLIQPWPPPISSSSLPHLFGPAVAPGASVRFAAPADGDLEVEFSGSSPLDATNPFTVAEGTEPLKQVLANAPHGSYQFDVAVSTSFSAILELEVGSASDGQLGFAVSMLPTGLEARLVRTVPWIEETELIVTLQNDMEVDVEVLLTRPGRPDLVVEVPASSSVPVEWVPEGFGLAATLSVTPATSQIPGLQSGGTRLADIIVEPP